LSGTDQFDVFACRLLHGVGKFANLGAVINVRRRFEPRLRLAPSYPARDRFPASSAMCGCR
jgi:hypothetical protein